MRCLLFICWCAASLYGGDARFLGAGTIPPDARDQNDETIGAVGSGLTFDAKRSTYLLVSDRGPGDGTVDYRPRFDEARVKLVDGHLRFELIGTTILRDELGKPMTGLAPDIAGTEYPRMADGRRCIDPEAIAIGPDDTVYISDEYGPFLYQFRRDGTMLRSLSPPAEYLPRTASGQADFGEHGALVSGRVVNRGFEGMSIPPKGKSAILVLQSGLIQDGGKESATTRILMMNLQTGEMLHEWRYPFTPVSEIPHVGQKLKQNDLSASELLALSERRFLVLERDNGGANGSKNPKTPLFKCVYLVEVADDHALEKTLLIDLLTARHGDDFAAKWEGLAIDARDPSGRQRLLVASDNDFLNPILHLDGRDVPFLRAKRPQATQLLMFEVKLP